MVVWPFFFFKENCNLLGILIFPIMSAKGLISHRSAVTKCIYFCFCPASDLCFCIVYIGVYLLYITVDPHFNRLVRDKACLLLEKICRLKCSQCACHQTDKFCNNRHYCVVPFCCPPTDRISYSRNPLYQGPL